jgi:uncharacterized protein (TIGR03437 family)
MDKAGCWNGACATLLLCATAIALPAQTLTTLTSFNLGYEPFPVNSSLVQGADGNFYGTTRDNQRNSAGTVYKVTPSGTLTTLYSFCSQTGCTDGGGPSGLIQAADGNFYGTTAYGGAYNASYFGTLFKITPTGTLTTLYSFCSQAGCADGAQPNGVIQASDGNFYGTTDEGGNAYGTVFKITPEGALTTLHSFCSPSDCTDGANPYGLIQAADGNFYGTTGNSPSASDRAAGIVFKITPEGALTTLYSFCYGLCAVGPASGLIQAADGNFYGTTGNTVFKITPEGTLTTLCSFPGVYGPSSGLIQASDGNFYGATEYGPWIAKVGTYYVGTVFKVTPNGTLTTLYSFCSQTDCADGGQPLAGLIQASDGNFYGTTSYGGAYGDGTVFKLALSSSTLPAIGQSDGVVSGASFQAGVAPGSWITIFGTNLSSVTDTWANAIINGNLPPSLDGVSVSVSGVPAYIAYISPTEINALAPNAGTGTVSVTVTNSSGTSSPVAAAAQTVQPAFFQWGNYAVATTQNYGLAVKNGTFPGVMTAPAKPGEVIILWGTGFGPTSPSAPAGLEVPSSTTYYTANTVTVTVGGTAAAVYGAALTPGYAGLYQVAIQIPTSLADGDYPVVATVLGAQSPLTVLITVQD